jgi:hypothetical protein
MSHAYYRPATSEDVKASVELNYKDYAGAGGFYLPAGTLFTFSIGNRANVYTTTETLFVSKNYADEHSIDVQLARKSSIGEHSTSISLRLLRQIPSFKP